MTSQFNIILLSLKVAAVSTLLTLPVGVYLGWMFSRKSFRGKSLIDGAVNVPLVLPPVVTGYFLLILLGPSGMIGKYLDQWFGITLAFNWWAAVIAAAVVSLPLLVRAVRVAVDAVDVKLEEAASMLRAGNLAIFFTVTLPLAINGIIAGAVLAFARALGEFGATIIFASNKPGETQTIPLAIFTYLNQPDGEAKAQALVMVSILFSYASIILNEILLRRFNHAKN